MRKSFRLNLRAAKRQTQQVIFLSTRKADQERGRGSIRATRGMTPRAMKPTTSAPGPVSRERLRLSAGVVERHQRLQAV